MTRGMVYKLLFIIALIAFSVVLILPTVGDKRMQVAFTDAVSEEEVSLLRDRFVDEDYQYTANGNAVIITGRNITDAVMNEVRTLPGVEDASIEKHWAEEYLLAQKINLGLDLQGGMYLAMRANFENIEERLGRPLKESDRSDVTKQALELLRNRIDKFGVSEPSIRPRGTEVIEIQLPGVKDPQGVKKAIGTTGRVEYRLVDDQYSQQAEAYLMKELGEETPIPTDPEELRELGDTIAEAIALPDTKKLLFFWERPRDTQTILPARPIVLDKDVALAGDDIAKAWVGQDEYGGLAVHFTTTAEGASKFADVTSEKNHGRRMAIVIDDKVRSAPSINVQISTGKAIITGDFTQEEVYTLARIIKEGALPVDLQIAEERTVGPSLGQDSIESGIRAILIGLASVVLFILIYYKLAGLVATFGLLLNMVFMLALLSWLGFTVTLPGIAGFILTVGMAVDANVIIYERIKEEIRNGKSVRMSIVYGFERAFWTIVDANLTTVLAALILSQVGSGPIKGFAVILLIGVLSSMFVALYVTRFIFEIVSLNKNMKKLSI